MSSEWKPFTELLSKIVDNRGKTCPLSNRGLPLIATNCINNDSLYPLYNTNRYVSNETYKNWFRDHPLSGDILFVCKGSPGRTNWVPDPVDFCIAQDMVAVRPDPTKIYPKYLFAALRSSIVQSQINNMHVGTMIPHFKKGDFDKLQIPVPSTNTQVFIGNFYFAISENISLLSQTNTTLESIAQALFKSWFVDFDPVRAKAEGRKPEGMDAETAALFPDSFEESELGSIPKGWGIATIDEMCDFQNGYAFKSNEMDSYNENVYKIFKMGNIKKGGGLNRLGVKDYFRKNKAEKLDRYLIKKGDLLMCMTDMKDKVALLGHTALMDKDDEFILNQRVGLLRSKFPDKANYPFLYILTNSHFFLENLRTRANSGVQVNLSTAEIKNTKFILPNKKVHTAFDRIAVNLQEKIFSLESEIEILIELRDILLPRLISGQLRLPEAEKIMETIS